MKRRPYILILALLCVLGVLFNFANKNWKHNKTSLFIIKLAVYIKYWSPRNHITTRIPIQKPILEVRPLIRCLLKDGWI